jgi:aspartyl-tRNA(Asn)/glutamyl-tRNA(Gln) amidotransferase subunit A
MLRESGDRYTDDVRVFLDVGETVLATQYIKALRVRTLVQQAFRRAFEGLDALVCPTLPAAAAEVGQTTFTFPGGKEKAVIDAWVGHSAPGNITGLPALTVPCGSTSAGLPIGLQVIGRPFDEVGVLRVGQAHESATDWSTRRPPL